MAKHKFKLFDFTKEGKGISKDEYVEDKPFAFTTFFKTVFRNFWGLTCLNFLYLLVNFPIFFGMFALSGNLNHSSSAPVSLFYPQLFGMEHIKASPFLQTLSSVLYGETTISVPTTTTLVFFGITLLAVFTFGISNCGMAYVLRGYARRDPVFLGEDFFDTIGKNWKQALPLGILDVIFWAILIYDFNFARVQFGFFNDIMFFLSIVAILIYFCMRFYMYVILITFDLPITKIIKNSFILALAGLKRNTIAFIGILLVVMLNVYIFLLFMPLGIILPFTITISLCSFIAIYCTYPNIQKYIIDPYYAEHPEEKPDDSYDDGEDDDPVFIDRG